MLEKYLRQLKDKGYDKSISIFISDYNNVIYWMYGNKSFNSEDEMLAYMKALTEKEINPIIEELEKEEQALQLKLQEVADKITAEIYKV